MRSDPTGGSILIVDDTVENLRLLTGMLGDRGYDPRPVTNGLDALEAMRHAPPDLILLDVTMPGLDGFEVCRRIKAQPEWRDIPVIFLTALTEVDNKVAGFAAGGTDYVTKPFHVEEVAARVATHLALRRTQSALRESYDQLQALEGLRDDLVKMIVHDMRGLLLVILANLDLARPELVGQPASDVNDAITAANRLNQMANDLLDVSRLEEGKMPIVKSSVNVTDLAAESARAASAMDATREIIVAEGAAIAACDATLLRRVLDNLVGNAMKHTPEGGTIRLGASGDGTTVRVTVQDAGAGVPAEAREQVFQKFGAARKDSKYHSSGLGLAFCRLAVEAHGGRIWVEPAEPRGSLFIFEVPA